jgi:Xaa-Pro dipeptidase
VDETIAMRLARGERVPFSDAEYARRRGLVVAAADAAGCDALLAYGAERTGSAVQWLTGWPVTREAALLVDVRRGEAHDLMWVQFHNHVPQAATTARVPVRWGGPSTGRTLADALSARGVRRLGVIGPVSHRLYGHLADGGREVVDLDAAYVRARLVKSDEELERLAAGAALTDLAALALRDGLAEGRSDDELLDLIERAYVPRGGTTHLHYLAITSMAEPDHANPCQWPTGRRLRAGDVVLCELSAAVDGYAGQVLRTMTMEPELTPRYADLHAVADAAFDAVCDALRPGATPADLVAAAGVIEKAGYTVIDDVVHGFGGGYLPPVLGSASRPAGPLPDLTITAGMTLVVQPNVVIPGTSVGVQTGELVVVTDDGARSLHRVPRGPWTGAGGGSHPSDHDGGPHPR